MDDSLDAEECVGPSSSSSSPPAPLPSPHQDSEQLQTKSLLRRSRIKRSCRRFFLDCSSDEEQQTDSQTDSTPHTGQSQNNGSNVDEDSWMCPLGTEGDAQGEASNSPRYFEPSAARTFQEKSKSFPGVILKLRRTCTRKRMIYRPILDSEKLCLETNQPDTESSQQSIGDLEKKTPEIGRQKRTSGPFSLSLRPPNAYPKTKLRSLLTIKYCPYLSACHSADYRRRWVLRSAVQRARRAMKIHYPDLVGKRIQHLYEEVDKSEVWYKGEVIGVHKANPNPLKTVFEVRYDSEPEWLYYLELLIDYKKGWLKIEE